MKGQFQWRKDIALERFIQQYPYDTSRAETQTRFALAYDEKYIYALFICENRQFVGQYGIVVDGGGYANTNANLLRNCFVKGIVAIISFFIGAVSTIQTAYQLVSPLVPLSTIAQIVLS